MVSTVEVVSDAIIGCMSALLALFVTVLLFFQNFFQCVYKTIFFGFWFEMYL